MPTLSTSRFPPPVSWEDLELLVWSLFKYIWNDPYTVRHGRSGQQQQGVDIFGRPDQGETWDGVQAKGKQGSFGQRVTEQELREEVQKARKFIPPLKNFILVTSARRDQVIQQSARQLSEESFSLGLFSVSVWGWDDIKERLGEFPDVIREHYPEFAVDGDAETHIPSVFAKYGQETLDFAWRFRTVHALVKDHQEELVTLGQLDVKDGKVTRIGYELMELTLASFETPTGTEKLPRSRLFGKGTRHFDIRKVAAEF